MDSKCEEYSKEVKCEEYSKESIILTYLQERQFWLTYWPRESMIFKLEEMLMTHIGEDGKFGWRTLVLDCNQDKREREAA